MRRYGILAIVAWCYVSTGKTEAYTTVFFSACQTANLENSGVTSDTISSDGYLFTYTRDKLFEGGTGQPIGRPVRVPWPDGVEAQAVTTPPPGVTDYKARITIQRVDGAVFDLPAFTAKLLANTYGAGGAIEIMPLVNGEDAFNDPLYFDVTGFYGQTFSYDTSPNPWGSTALLVGYDTYKVALYVDFAFVALTLESAVAGSEACCLSDNSCTDVPAESCLALSGITQGPGSTCLCTTCTPPIPIPATSGWTLLVIALLLMTAGTVLRTRLHRRYCNMHNTPA